MPFSDDLRRFGPDASYRRRLEEAPRLLRRLTASHYENFSVVTWLTPRPLRPGLPEHLRLLPMVRRPRRRGRRPGPRRSSCSPGGAASSGRCTRAGPGTPS